MLVRLLLLAAVVFLAWRLLAKKKVQRITYDPPSTRSPHEVLGVAPDATFDEIKAAYQKQMSLYHPDKVAGLGRELQEVAESRSKEITAAYATLRQRHGQGG
jgi:DnaJ-domain-containing protein 1